MLRQDRLLINESMTLRHLRRALIFRHVDLIKHTIIDAIDVRLLYLARGVNTGSV